MTHSINIDGVRYYGMCFPARTLAVANPALAKAERDFIAGKIYRYTTVSVEYFEAGGSTSIIHGPQKLKPARVL